MTAPSNANTSGLAPCPFCGGAPGIRQAMGETWVICGSCSASTQSKGRESVAFDLWNRRVTAASAQARIAELETEVKKLRTIMKGREELATSLSLNMNALAHDVASDMADRATAAEARADRLVEISSKLDAAISWLDYPFIDNRTPEPELRQRVGFMMKDAEPHRAALQQETKK